MQLWVGANVTIVTYKNVQTFRFAICYHDQHQHCSQTTIGATLTCASSPLLSKHLPPHLYVPPFFIIITVTIIIIMNIIIIAITITIITAHITNNTLQSIHICNNVLAPKQNLETLIVRVWLFSKPKYIAANDFKQQPFPTIGHNLQNLDLDCLCFKVLVKTQNIWILPQIISRSNYCHGAGSVKEQLAKAISDDTETSCSGCEIPILNTEHIILNTKHIILNTKHITPSPPKSSTENMWCLPFYSKWYRRNLLLKL